MKANRGKRVLVVEDEQHLRDTISGILELNGFDVLTLDSGDKAIRILPVYKPHLILCDIRMPDYDGYWVLHEARKKRYAGQIPFVFISSKTERLDVRTGMDLGADDYLTKPFSPKELISVVLARLERASEFESSITGALTTVEKANPDDFLKLSPAEKRVISYVAQNETSAEIAQKLNISVKTVENHRSSIASKLQIKGHLGLVKYCLSNKKLILSQNWDLR
jgi:two-component system OmpR family response regulator